MNFTNCDECKKVFYSFNNMSGYPINLCYDLVHCDPDHIYTDEKLEYIMNSYDNILNIFRDQIYKQDAEIKELKQEIELLKNRLE